MALKTGRECCKHGIFVLLSEAFNSNSSRNMCTYSSVIILFPILVNVTHFDMGADRTSRDPYFIQSVAPGVIKTTGFGALPSSTQKLTNG